MQQTPARIAAQFRNSAIRWAQAWARCLAWSFSTLDERIYLARHHKQQKKAT